MQRITTFVDKFSPIVLFWLTSPSSVVESQRNLYGCGQTSHRSIESDLDRRYWIATRFDKARPLFVRNGRESISPHQPRWLPPTFIVATVLSTAQPSRTTIDNLSQISALVLTHRRIGLDGPAAVVLFPGRSLHAHGRMKAATTGTTGRISCQGMLVVRIRQEALLEVATTLDVLL